MINGPKRVRNSLFCGIGVLALVASSIVIALPAAAFPIVHTVTFMENVNVADQVNQLESSSVPTSLTPFADMSPAFTDPGYTFTGWNTSADGTGTSFTDDETYSFTDDTGMYAQWLLIPMSHSVTFFENDNGTDTVSTFMTASHPTQLTAYSNIRPVFQDAGGSFTGWNTAADGSGTSYADGSLYSFNVDIGLYAQWTAPIVNHEVIFDENARASDAVTSSQTMSAPSSLTLFSNLQPTFVNAGHLFTDWNTAANGSGTSYANGANFGFTSDIEVFAQWSQAVPSTIEITLNEGSIGSPIVSGLVGSTIILPILSGSLNPGFSFEGWNMSANGSSTAFAGGASFVLNDDITLFAQWIAVSSDLVTITLSANGGSGTAASLTGDLGGLTTLPGQLGLIRSGFVMISWNTDSNGKGVVFLVGQVITLTNSMTLYAQWKGHEPISLFGAVGSFRKNSSLLSSVLKSQVERLALTVRIKKYSNVTLYGYTATTGLASLNYSLSRARAQHVASYLRSRLNALRIKGVSIRFAGEGAIAGESGSAYSRVEVFGV
ncbi:MAG TPA: InlB B-repeat-containing protein [Acidimicrobiales bacterium]